MENASRALVIAGGVLLSLIIIGVVMFAYRGITSLQKEKDISLSNEQNIDTISILSLSSSL